MNILKETIKVLEAQSNTTCEERMTELNKMIVSKMREIDDLLDAETRISEKSNEKNAKNTRCQNWKI